MKSYLVYRHGSNAANQSMTPVMAVGFAEGETYEAALAQANEEINCYANQYLSLVAEDDLTDEQIEEWNWVSAQE